MAVETVQIRGSSHIAAISYDPDTDTLGVTFTSGDSYDYFNVPQGVFAGFKAAGSAGSFFQRQIKGRYSYEQT